MHPRTPILIFLIGLLATAGWTVDRLLTRDDRIRFDEEQKRLWDVRDAILRFHQDRERFPEDLNALVGPYLPAAMTQYRFDRDQSSDAPLHWDPEQGELGWPVLFPIQGLIRHDQPLRVAVPTPRLRARVLDGDAILGSHARSTSAAAGDIVVEAEQFQQLSYGWEIGRAADAGGGAYIHVKEGRGDIDSTSSELHPERRAGDVYNVTRDNRPIEARCWFRADEADSYTVWVRSMAQRSVCSNMIRLRFGSQRDLTAGHNGSAPFVWLWHRGGTVRLRKGLNSFSFRVYQDGVKIDQVLLTRSGTTADPNAQTFIGTDPPSADADASIPNAIMSLSSDTLMIGATNDPSVGVYVHNSGLDLDRASLSFSLDLPDGRTRERRHALNATTNRLHRYTHALELPRPLAAREYLLRCRLLDGETLVEERTLALFRNYDWRILGPLPYLAPSANAAPESTETPSQPSRIHGVPHTWLRYDDADTDHFGLMDFGRTFSGRTYNAMENAAVYGYTELMVDDAGEYLLKGMGDDNLLVWVNGVRALSITRKGSAIRTALDQRITLRKGLNRILFRLNQRDGQWQAGIRIRTVDDQVTTVRGIPFAEQSVSHWDLPGPQS